ncbi:single-stranded DNA-binding protein [Microbacterium gorillae]|uniref:single-stranded DNA-binding protein n=1 Tax=Microbacterium gorillae TaxID=1231063 RepID=UPI000AEBE701|nr:single-stranded DNA-binding protein [Microbacterium gorillae]
MTENITAVGNVASEPKQGVSSKGDAYTSFRLAAESRRRNTLTGEWEDGDPNWFTVFAYRALGENTYASVRVGDRVVVSGRLRLQPWANGDKQGTSVSIAADALGPDLKWGTTTFRRVRRGGPVDPDSGFSAADPESEGSVPNDTPVAFAAMEDLLDVEDVAAPF